ncbi:protein that induces appearance of [PIN+] prion when overproduced [Collariella sp. IMI 366227]|nr:protein that induces appearance of [PIN+] prion when overproduced [Collariella sp. IMI 366227]
MVSEDRQRLIETNRSLRLIKNELETLLEKGIIDDSAFDSITSLLPAETPSPAPPLPHHSLHAHRQPSHARPSTTASSPVPTHNSPHAPPSYAQSTASPRPAHTQQPRPAARGPEKPVLAQARALYRYAATDARDVSLERDDRVAVHEYMNADWWMGKNLRTGAEGIFPRAMWWWRSRRRRRV